MPLTERQREILREAEKNGGRFLLPRRSPERDANWADCEQLVRLRYADWLDFSSTFAPGIRLTGKPE